MKELWKLCGIHKRKFLQNIFFKKQPIWGALKVAPSFRIGQWKAAFSLNIHFNIILR